MRVRSSFTALLILLLILFCTVGQAQTIALPKECKLKFGDNMSWADNELNDEAWETKQLGYGFHMEDKKDTYIWFRIKVIIPSSIKAEAEYGKGVKLNLGKIDDIDETYFNGKLIGTTGSFPPNYSTQYQTIREYVIPVNEVLWDQENVIAVRAFSPDSWFGMYEGPYQLAAAQWSDFITVKHEIIKTGQNAIITKIFFKNTKSHSFEGNIKYQVLDINQKTLFSETKQIHIQPVIGFEETISFTKFTPKQDKIVRIHYMVTENTSSASISKEQIFLVDHDFSLNVKREPKTVVVNKVKNIYSNIDFDRQQMKGYLGNRMNQNLVERLLKIDVPGTMDGYLERPGHHPWAGEHIGKYLETAANVWRNTGNTKLKKQMDQMMFQLIHTQMPDGYLGTYTPDDYWTSWDVWSHKYNLYGLLAYYKNTGYLPALEACKKMGNLLCSTFGKKTGQKNIILAGTHVGMAATSVLDPMIELYTYTGDKRYLDFCYYMIDAWEQKDGPKIISALLETGKVTKVGNGKAYEMLSNFVGMLNMYKVTGDKKLLQSVLIAWKDIVINRLYITGTTSSHEYFQENQILPAGNNANMGEGCVTTTWIQLNKALFDITGKLEYIEQIEKSIYNHLLAAENPSSGCVSYYTSLMDAKPYNCGITCCTTSVPRGIAMIPYFGFGRLNAIPTLLLYEPAKYQTVVTTKANKTIPLSVQIETKYPESGQTEITLNGFQNEVFTFSLRVPVWSKSFTAKVGDQIFNGKTNQYLEIERKWKAGDKIQVSFEIPIKISAGGISYPGLVAYQRGAQILAYDSTLNTIANNKLLLKGDLKISNHEVVNSISSILPKKWIGKQAYNLKTTNVRDELSNSLLVLVPFADASQIGGSIKVWLPAKESIKK